MQALVELIAGFIAMLAAVALAQFGVDLTPSRAPDREVHRVAHCDEPAKDSTVSLAAAADQDAC